MIVSNDTPQGKHVVLTGMAIGLDSLTNLEFRPDRPFRCCLICGVVYQTEEDRTHLESESVLKNYLRRQLWSERHAKQHSDQQHNQLRQSGLFALPEAAEKLAAYGIISITDLVMDNEASHALHLSSPIPSLDAESV